MSSSLAPIPGISDIWAPEVRDWVQIEDAARNVFTRYGFDGVRTPIIERTEVFIRGIGEETDVVQKEMYTFQDRGGRSLTLRPEGTAGVMRAIAGRGLAPGEERRVFYMGPMFRGERPAAGRKRQFHQIGVEAVGRCAPLVDAECIAMLMHYLESIGIPDGVLMLNTRGTAEDRRKASAVYREHFSAHIDGMCENCRRRIDTNIWRILDCKEPQCQAAIAAAPAMTDLVAPETHAFFGRVLHFLGLLGIPYTLAPRLVRGLDYYEHTVFEITHSGLGAQNAVAGGGRYRLFLPGRKQPVEGVGFAAGMERLLLVRDALGVHADSDNRPHAYIVALGAPALDAASVLADRLRRRGLRILAETGGNRSMKAQLRSAGRAGAYAAIILGENELQRNIVVMKNLATGEQREFPADTGLERLSGALSEAASTPMEASS